MSTALDEQDAVAMNRGRRSGGREARRAMRAAPLADDIRPVRAGLEGGRYKPLHRERPRAHPRSRADRAGDDRLRQCDPELHRSADAGPARSIGADGRIRFPRRLVLATIKSAARHFTLSGQDPKHDMLIQGTQGALRHGGCRRASGRRREARIPRIAAAGHLRRRAPRRRPRQHPFLPAADGAARHSRSARDGLQHALRLRDGDVEACRHQLHGPRERRAGAGDALCDRRRRGEFPGAAVRLQLQLLRGAADEVRRGRLRRARSLRRGRHPDPAAVGRPGRRHRAGGNRRRRGAGGRRSAGRPDLRQRAEARPSGDLRHLAVRLRSAHRRHVRRLGRAGGADLGLRADGAVLRPARRLGRGHDGFQAARHPVRLRKGHHRCDGRACRASTSSTNWPACTPRCSASAWKA